MRTEVFNKIWFLKYQAFLIWFLNTNWGRSLFGVSRNERRRVISILPNNVSFANEDYSITTQFYTINKYSRLISERLKYVWRALHWWDMHVANPLIPQLNLGFDTFSPDSGTGNTTVDGAVQRYYGSGETWATIIAGAGTGHADTSTEHYPFRYRGDSLTDKFDVCQRGIFIYDTSSIGSGRVVTAAKHGLIGTGKNNGLGSDDLHVVSANPASNNDLVNADYSTLGSTSFGSVAYGDWDTTDSSTYNEADFNSSGKAAIDMTGLTKLGTKGGWDVNASFGGSWASGQDTYFNCRFAEATGKEPVLTVTHAAADSGRIINIT